jgi:hypothetical protein
MGYRVLLIAVTGKEPATIHDEYAVAPTTQYEEIPESPVTGAILPDGAYLLYINDDIVPDDRVLAKLSKDASLIACYANETVMDSLACAWVDGVEKWAVYHDAQQGIEHLEVKGNLPPQLASIQNKLSTQQKESDGVDYIFDIPIGLFVSLGGIRYNEDIEGAEPEPWQVLTRIKARKWWWPFG